MKGRTAISFMGVKFKHFRNTRTLINIDDFFFINHKQLTVNYVYCCCAIVAIGVSDYLKNAKSLSNLQLVNDLHNMMVNFQMDEDIFPYYSHFITWDNMFNEKALLELYWDVNKRFPPGTGFNTIYQMRANIEIQNKLLGRKI